MTLQTTIRPSVSVAFDRIWTLAASMECGIEWKDFACILRSHCHTESRPTVCPFCYTNRLQIPTFASIMQVSSPLWARVASTLWPAHGMLTFLHAAVHPINKALFVTSSFHSHNIIFVEIDVKRCFYFNWLAYYKLALHSTIFSQYHFFVQLGLTSFSSSSSSSNWRWDSQADLG